MLGAIAGDIIGSVFEASFVKTTDFPLFSDRSTFTDDTVLTIATADAILHQRDYAANYKRFARAYPHAGYGGSFRAWFMDKKSAPYNSWGNGSAMRVSPVGFAYDSLEAVLTEAAKSAMVTHNHPEGVKGAQATAAAIFLARNGQSKDDIRREITARFQYRLDMTLAEIRPSYYFDVSCQGSVPQSIIAFLESYSVESAIRNAVSLGGDADTMACIAGGIAHAFYQKIPAEICEHVKVRLPKEFRQIWEEFKQRFNITNDKNF